MDGSLRHPVQRERGRAPRAQSGAYDAPENALSVALAALVREPSVLPTGSFVFVVSDFLVPVPARIWMRLRALRWDVVPVIVQDPVWEQTFPRVGGAVLPLAAPATGLQLTIGASVTGVLPGTTAPDVSRTASPGMVGLPSSYVLSICGPRFHCPALPLLSIERTRQ